MTETAVDSLFVAFQQALVGRYSLERELGRGGMGVVYLAREVRLDRPVAIKLLPPEYAAVAGLRDRFLREARTAARLSHPYIVPIHAVDEIGGFVFHVMAYVDGETLSERVRAHGPMKPGDVTRIMREMAWALAYAHAQGVVHRDIKPANIMLERGGERAMVMDFGIARLATVSGETMAGELLGTPEYMSPEQACGEAVDGRSDLYSLGMTGYFALSGALPFTGSAREVLAQQVTKIPAPVANVARAAPRTLAAAIDQCLAKDPAQRFPTGEALADALAPALEKTKDIPVPLRVFLDRRRMMAMVVPPAVGIGLLPALIQTLAHAAVAAPSQIAVLVVGTGMIFAPLAILHGRLRQLMRHGYSTEDVAAALRTLNERKREEFLYEFGPKPSTREKGLRTVGLLSLAMLGLVAVGMATHVAPARYLGPLIMLPMYGAALGLAISGKWRRLRQGTGSRWAAFWHGRVGHMLGRMAGYKLGARTIPADRPTELGIAMSAEALYVGFPKELKKSLGDVPTVLRGLEAHARAMRARISELDASIQDAQRTPSRSAATAVQDKLVADLQAARAAAEQRLSDCVTALETLRLDLLRLQAGAGSADSITQNLVSARALGDDVDRLLAGGQEVDVMLTSRRPESLRG